MLPTWQQMIGRFVMATGGSLLVMADVPVSLTARVCVVVLAACTIDDAVGQLTRDR